MSTEFSIQRETAVEELSIEHLPGLLALNDALDWTFTAGDVETMFAGGRVFGHFDGSSLISSAAVFEIGTHSASIGAVMVHPGFRRRGLAKRLMRHVHHLDGFAHRKFRLVATEEGVPLYNALGYQVVTCLSKMVRAEKWITPPAAPAVLRPLRTKDLGAVIALDAEAVGGERPELIAARYRQAFSHVVAEDPAGRIIGFAIGADQRGQLLCGPVVTGDPVLALGMLHRLGSRHQGTIRIDVPDENRELLSLLREHDFHRETNPPVMVLGDEEDPPWGPGFNAPIAQMFG